jgi:hypothetical protein
LTKLFTVIGAMSLRNVTRSVPFVVSMVAV